MTKGTIGMQLQVMLAAAVVMAVLLLSASAVDSAGMHTISYEVDGGTDSPPEPVTAEEGSTINLANYYGKRDGYEFSGWSDGYIEYMPGSRYVVGSIDVVMKAVWTPIRYTVIFDSNGGTGATQSYYVKYDVQFPNPASDFSRSGYNLDSWNTSRDGSGTSFPAVGNLKNITDVDGSYVTLYAQWTPMEFKVTYRSDSLPQKQYVDRVLFDSKYTFRGETYTKTGSTQIGWANQIGGEVVYPLSYEIAKWTMFNDLALYPVWQVDTCTITFDPNGGTGEMRPITEKYDTRITVPECGYTLDNYSFKSWNTSRDGSGTTYNPGDTIRAVTDLTLYAQWTHRYSITYQLNGGTGDYPVQEVLSDEDELKMYLYPDAPTRVGYTFLGWGDSEWYPQTIYDAGAEVILTGSSTSLILYAQWTADTYTVTYKSGLDGQLDVVDKAVYDESYEFKGKIFTKEGYDLTGWSKVQGQKADYALDYVMPKWTMTEDLVLYAYWFVDVYVVTFQPNGGTGAARTVTADFGSTIIIPESSFSRAGYEFDGWNKSIDGSGSEYAPGDSYLVLSDSTLYAMWAATYTIKFNANGGSGAPATMVDHTRSTYITMTLPLEVPTREGYEFEGWGITPRDSELIYKPGSTIELQESNRTVALYAQWTPLKFKVTYTSGSTHSTDVEDYAEFDTTYVLKDALFTKAGYTQTGWSSDGGMTVYPLSYRIYRWTSMQDVTMTAVWTANVYTVTFNPNGGSGTMSPITVDHGESVKIPTCKFHKDGYEFQSWNTLPDGTGRSIAEGASIMVTGDMGLYAQWSNIYSLSFDPNGGMGGPSRMISYTDSDSCTFTIPQSSPRMSGHEFLGWSTSSKATAPQYGPGSAIVLTQGQKDMTLYAVWSEGITYTIVYQANGGSGAPEMQSEQSTAKSLRMTISGTTPSRSGYGFAGWSTVPGDLPSYYAGGTVTVYDRSPQLILYAVWSGSAVDVESVEMSFAPDSLAVGSTMKMKAVVYPDNSTQKDPAWSVSDTSVASITSDGSITGLKPGNVTVTARAGGAYASVIVAVTAVKDAVINEHDGIAEVINSGDIEQAIDASRASDRDIDVRVSTDMGRISMDSSVIASIKGYSKASLTLETLGATVILSSAALKGLASAESRVDFVVKQFDISEIYPDMAGMQGLELTTLVDGVEKQTNFGDRAIVKIGYALKEGQDPDRIKVYYITGSGVKESVAGTFYDDGSVWMTTNHFSYYAVDYEAPAQQSDWLPYVAAVVFIIIALLLIIIMRRGDGPKIFVRSPAKPAEDGGSSESGVKRFKSYIPPLTRKTDPEDAPEESKVADKTEPKVVEEEPEEEDEDEEDEEESYTVSISVKP